MMSDHVMSHVIMLISDRYTSKLIEKKTEEDIRKADIDVIGVLLNAQSYNANQLAAFCMHFISQNYQPMKGRPEFEHLVGENLKYIEEHQWPPVSYLKKLEEFEKIAGKNGKNCIVM